MFKNPNIRFWTTEILKNNKKLRKGWLLVYLTNHPLYISINNINIKYIYLYLFCTQSVFGHMRPEYHRRRHRVVFKGVFKFNCHRQRLFTIARQRRCIGLVIPTSVVGPPMQLRERIHRRRQRGREGAFSHPFDIKRRLNEALFPVPTHLRCHQTVSSHHHPSDNRHSCCTVTRIIIIIIIHVEFWRFRAWVCMLLVKWKNKNRKRGSSKKKIQEKNLYAQYKS